MKVTANPNEKTIRRHAKELASDILFSYGDIRAMLSSPNSNDIVSGLYDFTERFIDGCARHGNALKMYIDDNSRLKLGLVKDEVNYRIVYRAIDPLLFIYEVTWDGTVTVMTAIGKTTNQGVLKKDDSERKRESRCYIHRDTVNSRGYGVHSYQLICGLFHHADYLVERMNVTDLSSLACCHANNDYMDCSADNLYFAPQYINMAHWDIVNSLFNVGDTRVFAVGRTVQRCGGSSDSYLKSDIKIYKKDVQAVLDYLGVSKGPIRKFPAYLIAQAWYHCKGEDENERSLSALVQSKKGRAGI